MPPNNYDTNESKIQAVEGSITIVNAKLDRQIERMDDLKAVVSKQVEVLEQVILLNERHSSMQLDFIEYKKDDKEYKARRAEFEDRATFWMNASKVAAIILISLEGLLMFFVAGSATEKADLTNSVRLNQTEIAVLKEKHNSSVQRGRNE